MLAYRYETCLLPLAMPTLGPQHGTTGQGITWTVTPLISSPPSLPVQLRSSVLFAPPSGDNRHPPTQSRRDESAPHIQRARSSQPPPWSGGSSRYTAPELQWSASFTSLLSITAGRLPPGPQPSSPDWAALGPDWVHVQEQWCLALRPELPQLNEQPAAHSDNHVQLVRL